MDEFLGNLQYILQSTNDSHIILNIKPMFHYGMRNTQQAKRLNNSPAPLAWTTLSGIRSLSKCASSSRNTTSCSSMGPRVPTVKLAPRLSTGAPCPATIFVFSV
jgi:hypothetical protein